MIELTPDFVALRRTRALQPQAVGDILARRVHRLLLRGDNRNVGAAIDRAARLVHG